MRFRNVPALIRFLAECFTQSEMTEAERSYSQRTQLLDKALCDSEFCPEVEGEYMQCWVMDVFDGSFVYRYNRSSFRLGYTIDDAGRVTLIGPPVEVLPTMTYPDAPAENEPVAEGKKHPKGSPFRPLEEMRQVEIIGDPCRLNLSLQESAGAMDLREASAMVKLIGPGWGSSGYYSRSLLQRVAPVFKKGLKMFIDHPTAAEEAARPEGSVMNLGGELTEDAKWREDLPDGPGLYAPAKIFERFSGALKDLKDSIGVSIRAFGSGKAGEAEGRKGVIIENITHARSTDFVTVAGAGGKVTSLMESLRLRNPEPVKESEDMNMTPEMLARFEALENDNKRLANQVVNLQHRESAREIAASVLRTITMPEASKTKVIGRLLESIPLQTDGKINEAAFRESAKTAGEAEVSYLRECGVPVPEVKNLGGSKQLTEADNLALNEKEEAEFADTLKVLRAN